MNGLSLGPGTVSVPGNCVTSANREREKSSTRNQVPPPPLTIPAFRPYLGSRKSTGKVSVVPPGHHQNQFRIMVEKDSNEEIEPRRNPVPVATKAVAAEPSVPEVTVFMDGELDNVASAPQSLMRRVPNSMEQYCSDLRRKSSGPPELPLSSGFPEPVLGQSRPLPTQPTSVPGQNWPLEDRQGKHYGPMPGQSVLVSGQNQPLQGQPRPLPDQRGSSYEQSQPFRGQPGPRTGHQDPRTGHQDPRAGHQDHRAGQQAPFPYQLRPLQAQQGHVMVQNGTHYPANTVRPIVSKKPDGNPAMSDNMPVYCFPGTMPAFNYPQALTPPHQQYVAAYPFSQHQNLYQPVQYRGPAVFSPEAPFAGSPSAPYGYSSPQPFPVDSNWPFVLRPGTPVSAVPPAKIQSILRNPLPKTSGNTPDPLGHSSGSTDSGLQINDSANLFGSPPQNRPPSVHPSPNPGVDIYQLYMEQKAEIEKLRQEIEDLRSSKDKRADGSICVHSGERRPREPSGNFQPDCCERCSVGVNTTQCWPLEMDDVCSSTRLLEDHSPQKIQSCDSRMQAQNLPKGFAVNTSIVSEESEKRLRENDPVTSNGDLGGSHQDLSDIQINADNSVVRLNSSKKRSEQRGPVDEISCGPPEKDDTRRSSRPSEKNPSSQDRFSDSRNKTQNRRSNNPPESLPNGRLSDVVSGSTRSELGGLCLEASRSQTAGNHKDSGQVNSDKRAVNGRSGNAVNSSPMSHSDVEQKKVARARKSGSEESRAYDPSEYFDDSKESDCDRIVEKWLDRQYDYVHESDNANDLLMNGQTYLSMLSTYSIDQSSLDQTYLPRIEYVARTPASCGSSELTIAADALAMKYLSDDALTRLQMSGDRRPGRHSYGTSRDASESGPWDHHHSSQMSFASQKYLQKHGLLPASIAPNRRRSRETAAASESAADAESEGMSNGVNVAVFFQKFPNDSRNSLERGDAGGRKNTNSAPTNRNSPVCRSSRCQSNALDRTLDLVGEVVGGDDDDEEEHNEFRDFRDPVKERADGRTASTNPGVDLILDYNINNFPKLL